MPIRLFIAHSKGMTKVFLVSISIYTMCFRRPSELNTLRYWCNMSEVWEIALANYFWAESYGQETRQKRKCPLNRASQQLLSTGLDQYHNTEKTDLLFSLPLLTSIRPIRAYRGNRRQSFRGAPKRPWRAYHQWTRYHKLGPCTPNRRCFYSHLSVAAFSAHQR